MAQKKKSLPKKVILEKKKPWSLTQKLGGFAEIMRPIEWSKSFLNMLLALFIAYYVYTAGVSIPIFVIGFIAVALLWSALYTLNDWTDWKIDALHPVKKNRPIPSGRVSPTQAFWYAMLLLVLSYGIAFWLNNFLLVVCLTAMVINQFLYTMKPFRFKSRKGLDLISGSMINPIFRYTSGLVLFVPPAALFAQIPPLLPYVFVICIQFSGYSLYRLFSTGHDKKLNMKSTVALVSEKKVRFVSYAMIGVAVVSYIMLFVNGATLKNEILGYLPIQFVAPILICVLGVPFFKDAVLSPSKANMTKSYRVVYWLTIIFIIANIVVFLVTK